MKAQTKPFVVVIKPSRRLGSKRVVRPVWTVRAALSAEPHKIGETRKPTNR